MKKVYFSVILLLILSTIVGFNFSFLAENPFSKSFEFDYPYKAIMDSEENSYVIDMSKRRIVKIDSEGKFEFKIDGGLRGHGTLFYANDLAVDYSGNLYILNIIPDTAGFYTKQEEILRFSSKGEFIDKIYERVYEEEKLTLIQRGELTSLTFKNEVLSWFALNENEVIYYWQNLKEDSRPSLRKLPYNEANVMLYDVKAIDENKWIFTTKQGEIKIFDFQRNEFVFSTMVDENDHLRVRYSLFVSNGDIYFTDIGNLSLYKYIIGDNEASEERIFSVEDLKDIEASIFYFVNINQSDTKKILTTAIDNSIIQYDLTENELTKIIDNIEYKYSYILKRAAVYLAAIFSLFFIIYLAIFIYKNKLNGKLPAILYKAASIIIIVAVATTLIVTMMLSNFSQRYENVVIEKSSLMVQLISKKINGDLIENIKSQKDYMGSDYREIRNNIVEALNYNKDKWNEGYYFAIYRLVDDVLCGFMYLSDEIGPVYPFMGWYEEEGSIPSQAFEGAIVYEKDADKFGTWIYSMGPIENSRGEVVAIIEIGTDLYSFNQENKKLIQSILLDVVTMLVILILISIEILYFGYLLRVKKEFDFPESQAALRNKHNSAVLRFSYSNFVRPFNFIYSLAISMSIAFVPIMMKNLYTKFLASGAVPLFGLPSDVVIALPISIEMLLFGIALLLGGAFITKIGWRHLQIIGIAFAIIGLFLSGYSTNVYLFLFSRGVVGFGSGFVLLAARSIINLDKDTNIKSISYSNFYSGGLAGITVGAVFGGFFADHLGFSNVFYMAFCIGIIALIFAYKVLISNKSIINKVEKTALEKLRLNTIFKFLFNIKVLSYFILIIIPTYAAGMFLAYYLPLFADAEGLNVSDIGRLFMLHGLIIIYLGPVVSILAKKTIKNDRLALMVGSIGWAVSLIIFALTGNIWGVVVTLAAMALTEGFCVVAQNDYFLGLKIVQEIGEDIAVSYFEIAAKIAEIVAPLIFGWVLIMGATKGMWAFGIAILAATFLFFIMSNIKEVKYNE